MSKFGEILVNEGLVTQEQLREGLERQVMFGGKIGTNLIELGFVDEQNMTKTLGKFLRIEASPINVLDNIPDEIIQTISREIAEKYKIIPYKLERKRLYIVMDDMKNMTTLDEIKFISGYDVVPSIISEIRLLYGLEKFYGIKRDLRFVSILDEKKDGDTEEKDVAVDLTKVKEAFVSVKDKGEVAGILINEAKKVAKRAAIFMIKGNKLETWVAKGLNADGFNAKIEPNSVIYDVLAKKNYYRGPILNVLEHNRLLAILGGSPSDALVMPIGIRDKTIGVLYADNGLDDVLTANLNYLNTLIYMASVSFEILIMKKKIMDM